jgi:hypothetical protein
LGDVNRDGITDLIGVTERGPTGSGMREAHVLNGATNFRSWLLNIALPIGLDDPENWEFVTGNFDRDNYADLVGIIEIGPTGSNRKEAHGLSGSSNFQSFIIHAALPLGLDDPTNWEFESGDVNRDGFTDLVGVLESGSTGSGMREMHVASGVTGFQTFALQTATALGLDDAGYWEFGMADVNHDGAPDLIGIIEQGPTGSGRRELHASG